MRNLPAYLSLFTSASTLVCCALPALVIAVAGGAAMAGLVSSFPQLVWLSEQKYWLFSAAALMLSLGGWLQWKNRNAPCPIETKAAQACMKMRRVNKYIYGFSLVMFATGAFFAFIAPRLL